MNDKVVKDDPSFLQFVPDWFVTQKQVKIWHDDNDYDNDYEIIGWLNDYQKRKAQTLPIQCHSMFLRKKSGCLNIKRFEMRLSHSYLKKWQQSQ